MIHCFYKQRPKLVAVIFLVFGALCAHTAQGQDYDCSLAANCSAAAGTPQNTYCVYPTTTERGCRCFDGVDNDGDGKIDKADSNCATYYGLTFVGEGSDCSITPPGANTPFDLVNAPITSAQNTADTQSKVSVGDVDGDGIPDAVITSKWNSEIRVVATAAGQPDGTKAGDVKSDFNLSGKEANDLFDNTPASGICHVDNGDQLKYEHENLIADIDGDGKGEMYGIISNRNNSAKAPPACFYLVGFTYAPATLTPLFKAVAIGGDRPGTFGIADMDGDGKAEIYMRDRIYAAETGVLLATATGTTSTTAWDTDVTSAPTAANITGDTKMELICGTKIYSIPSLSNRNPASPSTLTLVKDMNTITTNKCFVKIMIDAVEYGTDTHSSCSIADIDRDGNIDVVISGALNSTDGKTAIFYWNVAKNTSSYYLPIDPSNTNGWPWGTGRVNLIDTDKDGLLDMFFIAGNQIYRVETIGDTFSPTINSAQTGVTQKTINDSRSGVLTVTVYDFDNNGEFELVYRDSQELAVVDAATMSTKYWSATCQSHTYTEGPIIADVNGDGGTDICVTCNTSNAFDITDDIQQQALGQFRLYYSSGNEWLPTRQVWNQPGYFVVNVNDDLTLPFPQLDQTLVFGTAPCPNGLPGPQQPLNVFLNQVPYLSANGCPVFPAPDLAFYGDDPDFPGVDTNGDGIVGDYAVKVDPPICGDEQITVRIQMQNSGDLPITATVPVSFFNGDPTEATISADSLLYKTNLSVSLAVDEIKYYTVTFNGPGTSFRLYTVLYNNGSVLPISLSGASTVECTIDNNMYDAYVDPFKFDVKILKIKDNETCDDAANNGALQAQVFRNGVQVLDLSPYSFQWYSGPIASPVLLAGKTGVTLTNITEGTYSLQGKHIAKGCLSTFDDEIVGRIGRDYTASITVLSDQTQCDPPNGSLQAVVPDPGVYTYTYEWRNNSLQVIGNTATISGLEAKDGPFQLTVTSEGCQKFPSMPIQDPDFPSPEASTLAGVEDCLNPTSGSVTSKVFVKGIEQDPANFTFSWYYYNGTRGTIVPGGETGPTRTGLPAGFYEVVVTDNLTGCTSDASTPELTEVPSTLLIPTVVASQVAEQTSCDLANPNGIVTAVATAGSLVSPNDFTFQWFKGDNTLGTPLTTTSGLKGETLNKVAGGGQIYTVKATTANNCSATGTIVITEDMDKPIIKLDSINNSVCDPALAASAYNGSAFFQSATFDDVNIADFTGYTITWHDGSLTTDAVIAGQTASTLPSRDGGFYTVVVEKTDVKCKSDPTTIQILNATVLPVIDSDSIPSISCNPALATGQARVVDVDGLGTGAPYSFEWFTGNTTATPFGATTATITNLQGGATSFYTVRVTNGTTGCQNTSTVLVTDGKVLPLITYTTDPNTICNAALTSPSLQYDGAVHATISNQGSFPITDYNFVWEDEETDATVLTANGLAGKDLLNRDSSLYTVVVEHISTGCFSSPVTAQVVMNVSLPIVSTNAVASTNCDPALANGQALVTDVNGAGTGSPFIFQWYDGNNTSTIINGATSATLANKQGGVGEFYTVLVTDQSDGCQNTKIVEIPDAKVLPLFTLLASPNTICDASLTSPAKSYDGSIVATVTNLGALGLPDYNFEWTDEETNGLVLDANGGGATLGEQLLNRDSSLYTLVVKQTSTGCVSNPVSEEIVIDVDLPVITASAVASTNCDPALANGKALVTDVDGAGIGVPYVFQWFDGNTTTTAIGGATAATLNNLQGGVGEFYTARVTDQSNGCRNISIVEIPDNRVLPLFTLLATPNTICDATLTSPAKAYDGSIVATVTNLGALGLPDYNFEWTDEESNTLVLDANGAGATLGEQLLNRDSSLYTLVVKQISTGCVSNPVSEEIVIDVDLPVITASAVGSTNCDPALANGKALVTDVDGAGIGVPYVFQWFDGNTTTTAIGGATAATLNNLQGGVGEFYTARVTDQSNGCRNISIVEIPDNRVLPLFTLLASPTTICDATLTSPAKPYDGSIVATVTNLGALGLPDYNFEWTDEESNTLILDANGGGATLGEQLLNRDSSDYTLIVKQISTGCVSNPVSTQIVVDIDLPVIVTDANGSTNCDPALANGQALVVTVDGAAPGAPFVFQWFDGNSTATILAGETNSLLDDRQGGVGEFYTIRVTNQNDGCRNTAVIEIPDERVLPLFTLLESPTTICDATLTSPAKPFDGSIVATVTNLGALGLPDYNFEWTDEESNTLVLDANGGGATLGEQLLNRDSSHYTLLVKQLSTGCVSNPVTGQITMDVDLPVIVTDANGSTNCDPALANGQALIMTVDGAAPGAPFVFQWFDGNTTATTLAGETNSLLDDRQGGVGEFYTVRVTNQDDGCRNTAVVEIPDERVLPLFTLLESPTTICDATLTSPAKPFDGSIVATVSNLGMLGLPDYNFEWTDEESNTLVLDANGGGATLGEQLLNRDSSYYTLVVKQLSTGCVSSPVTGQITMDVDLPVIVTDANGSTNCDPALANGQALVMTVDGAAPGAPFVFQWFDGNTTATTLAGETNSLLDNRQGGAGEFYTVRVTNQDDGCRNTAVVEIPDERILPLFTLDPDPNTVCDNTFADFTGQVVATLDPVLFGGFSADDFNYQWTDEETSSVVFTALGGAGTGESLVKVDSSDFTLVVTQVSTGCISSPVTAQVTAAKVLPVITTAATPSTNCDINKPNGLVEVTDIDTGGVPNNHTFIWYRGAIVAAGEEVANSEVSLDTLQGSPTRVYTVLVTDLADGCQNTQSISLPHAPVPPAFTLTPSPNTICDATKTTPAGLDYDGKVVVLITNQGTFPITDYHFDWTDEEDGSLVLNADGGAAIPGEVLDKVDSSFYSLVLTQISTGCTTGPITTEVEADFTLPTFTIAEVPQTSCDVSAPNGILTVTTADNTLYDFEWKTGNIAGAGTLVADAPEGEISGQPGNLFYNVLVRTHATGCENTETTYLNETIAIPTVTLNGINPQADCTNPDGEVTATVLPAITTSYEYYWMREEPLTTTTDPAAVITEATTNLGPGKTTGFYNRHIVGVAGTNVDTNPELVYGTYTMVVKDVFTQCISETYTAVIPDQTQSTITINVNAIPTTCNDAGSMDIEAVRDDGAVTNFSFEVFKGGPVNPTVPIDYYSTPPNPPFFDGTLNNPDGGDADAFPDALQIVAAASGTPVTTAAIFNSHLYTVVATDAKGCKTLDNYFLPFADAHSVTSVFQPSTICPYDVGNGTIAFRAIYPTTGPAGPQESNQSDFIFRVYAGGAPVAGSEIPVPAADPSVDATVTATEVVGDAIDNDGDGSVDETDAFVEGTNPYTWPGATEKCNDAIDNDGDGKGDATDPDCIAYVSVVNLAPGFYTVEIEETYSGSNCKVQEIVEIKSTALNPQIDLVGTVISNSACDLTQSDGSITIQVDRHPDDTTPGPITFDVDMNPDPNSDFIVSNVAELGNVVADELGPDDYTFTVTASTGCQSTKSFTVLDQPNVAQIVDGNVDVFHAEFCDPALETSARAEITLLSVTDTGEICGNGMDDDGDGLVDGLDPDCNDNIADYEFVWYSDAALTQVVMPATDGLNAGDGGEVLTNNGNLSPGLFATVGTYYVVATKEDEGVTGGVGCFSAPFRVEIEDRTVNPVAALYPFGNTSCDNFFEGSIEVEATTATLGLGAGYTNPGATGTYKYVWTGTITSTTTGNNGDRDNTTGADNDVLNSLEDGTYDLLVVNEASGCSIPISTEVLKISPPVFTMDLAATPQDVCDPAGTVTITDVFVDGASDGTANFEYTYYLDDPTSAALAVPNTTVLLDVTALPTIGAGSYYVVATRKDNTDPGSGCSSAPHRIDIDDTSEDPTVVLTPFTNTSCSTTIFEGGILVEVTDEGSLPTATYTYTWDAANPTLIANTAIANNDATGSDDNPTLLKEGVYNVTVENNATGCVVASQTTILKSELPVIITAATSTPQDVCDPDGSVTVTTVTVAGGVEPNPDFAFTWFQNDPSTQIVAATANNTVLDVTDFATIGAGTYYVVAKRIANDPGRDCISAPLRVDIEDQTEDPTVVMTPFTNTSCSTTIFEGSILVDVTDPGSVATATYTYTWNAANPTVIANTAVANDDGTGADDNPTLLKEGVYNLDVENNATGCVVSAQTTILKTELPVIITDATSTPQDVCDPDGSVTVTQVTVAGSVEPNPDFDFTWFQNDPSTQIVAATTNNSVLDMVDYPTIGAGTYYVVAKRTANDPGRDCVSAPLRVDIQDQTEDPTVVLTPFTNTSCSTMIFEGAILVDVTDEGSLPTATYTYTWDAANPTVIANTAVANDDLTGADDNPTLLKEGVYNVTVENNATGCVVSAQTTILKTELPVIITSATPIHQLICDPAGSITVNNVTVSGSVEPNPDFDFTWFKDDPSTQIVAATTNNVLLDIVDYPTIGAGTYYVVAKRTQNDPGRDCVSAPLRVDIEDQSQDPTVVMTPFSNTSCSTMIFEGSILVDVTSPGSMATATYTYTWNAANPTVIPNTAIANDDGLGTDDNPINLQDGVYDMTVENNATGCVVSSQTTVLKTELPVIIAQTATLPQDICNPDGSAQVTQVTVDGTVDPVATNFDFTWYRDDLSNPIIVASNGEDQIDVTNVPTIAAGSYYVEIKRISTISPGADCKSAPIKIDIEDQTENPSVVLTPFSNTSCSTMIFEGSIEVQVTDPGSAPTATYTYDWAATNPIDIEGGLGPVAGNDGDGDGSDGDGDNPTSLSDGDYQLIVTNDASGCTVTAQTTVLKTELPVIIAQTASLPQDICNPDGTAQVTQVTVNGIVDPVAANFDFTWYRDDLSTPIIVAVNGEDQIDVTNVPTIAAGSYFVEIKRISTISPGADCKSAPIKIDIEDQTENPSVVLTPFANTSCSTMVFEGGIQVQVTDAGSAPTATYTYDWAATNPVDIEGGLGPVGGNDGDGSNADGDGDNPTALSDGVYQLVVTNDASGCEITAETTIFKNELPIVIAEATPTPQVLCNPDGSILVTKVMVGGLEEIDHPDFDFTWYKDDLTNEIIAPTAGEDLLDVNNFTSIEAGTYFVQVKRTTDQPGFGCVSAPLRVDIENNTVNPTISVTSLANTTCDGTGQGSISVVVLTSGSGPVPASYTYDWAATNPSDIEGGGGPVTGNNGNGVADGDGDNPTGLLDGVYDITVINPATGCVATGQTNILLTPLPVDILEVNKQDQMICNPDGSIQVLAVAPLTVGDYTFNWYQDDPASAALQDGGGVDITAVTLDETNFASIGAGTYYVIGEKIAGAGSGCRTAPFRVDILDLHDDPQLAFSSIANSACNDLKANGSVTVNAFEPDGSVGTYAFTWTLDGGPLAAVPDGGTSTISNALDGAYVVTATNQATGCPSTGNFDLLLDLVRSTPNIIDTDEIHPTDCFPTGASSVMEVTLGSTSNTVLEPGDNQLTKAEFDGRLTFEWFANDPTTAPLPIADPPFETDDDLLNVLPGTYYVKVKDASTDCVSDPKEVVINDDFIIYPTVTIVQTKAQASCDPLVGTAELMATANDGTNQANFDFFWFGNLDATGSALNAMSNAVLSNLIAGDYSVEILDHTSNCKAENFYVVPDEGPIFTPELSISIEPRTNCVDPNGFIIVRETRNDDADFVSSYPYRVVDPLDPALTIPNPNYEATVNAAVVPKNPGLIWRWDVNGLDTGIDYVVKVVDLNSGCEVEQTVQVPAGYVYPNIVVTPENPLTHCDPAIPNGQMSALVDGSFIGYDFEWKDADGNVKSLEYIARSLAEGSYTVTATNQITFCSNSASGTIETAFVYPPTPLAETVFDQRSCIVDDGWVTATVDGETLYHSFDWYVGMDATTPIVFTGPDYTDIPAGIYAVTATDIVTGCVSQPDTALVRDNRRIPEIFFKTTPSFCADVNPAAGSGMAELQLSPADIIADDIEWKEGIYNEATGELDGTGNFAGSGSYITEQFPGFYTAFVTTSFGCKKAATAEIETEILTYNLVTTNNDSKNDAFIVDCLSLFENNNVKIFNRSGVLVYEADGYDNQEVVFKGYGEKGVYAAGNLLPVGTYFYIIDKRDGTKPRTGFLELTR
jgi:hypothetical protein